MPPPGKFQVKLAGEWKDYAADEDKILKRAYLAGFPNAKYMLRRQSYEINFAQMTQKNVDSGKSREIRQPHKWKPPGKPIVKPGKTFVVKVPKGGPGKLIQVPHPTMKGQFVAVNVPATAKVGQSMLVPIPEGTPSKITMIEESAADAYAASASAESKAKFQKESEEKAKKKGWSTGAKVAAGTAGVVVVGGVAVAGAVIGEHIAEEGWDATMEELGDMASTAGASVIEVGEDGVEAITPAAEAAGDWCAGAGEDVADLVMDLF